MKVCPYCKIEIAQDAIKCGHCREWLNTKTLSFKNPYIKFGTLILLLYATPALIGRYFIAKTFENTIKKDINYSPQSKLKINSHHLKKSNKGFYVVGEIINADTFVWSSISILVTFRNAKKEVSNVASTNVWNIKPGESRGFEVDFGCSGVPYDAKEHVSYEIEIEEARGIENSTH